jgi:uncharacterized membrane protein YgcG
MVLADDFGTGEVFLSMLWFFLFFIWIWILIMVFADLFRSHDLSGWAKALWVIFVIILPYLGVFVYLIACGHKMSQHAQEDAQRQQQAFNAAVRQAAGTGGSGGGGGASTADELARLADLKAKGVIDDAEFEQLKQKAISGG